jgi:hypothetical protein
MLCVVPEVKKLTVTGEMAICARNLTLSPVPVCAQIPLPARRRIVALTDILWLQTGIRLNDLLFVHAIGRHVLIKDTVARIPRMHARSPITLDQTLSDQTPTYRHRQLT